MFGHFGFSYIGLIYLVMLFIPNGIWAKHKPYGYNADGENRILSLCERIGQIFCTVTILIFSDYNPTEFTSWIVWLFASAFLMLLYEAWWIKYFAGKKTLKSFYGNFLGIPLPGAMLPVIGFLLLGIYGKVIWLVISAVILGIGHIGIHILHIKTMRQNEK
jgi:hypothetical protein